MDRPDWKEQFGRVLIEAMACRVPVVGSTAGEIPHVIKDAGLIFPQNNVSALAEKLSMLMSDKKLREEMGKKGLLRVKECYTHQVIAKKTVSFWQRLLQE